MELDKFNATINIWIDELRKYSLHYLLSKPDEMSWSLGQLYEHILEETRWYFGQIEVSLNDKDHTQIETSEAAKTLFERGAFEDKMIQGDPLISERVRQPTSIEELTNDFVQLKNEAERIWNQIRHAKAYGKSEHPGMGFLNCFEWFEYAEMHMRHHLKQKARIDGFLAFGQ
ncbi:MAG TPA: hypothetical protein VGD90_10690 [Sphingobacteriaceae bacterium]